MRLCGLSLIFVQNGSFGGFPAWLLNESGRMRSNNPTYLKHVAEYYDVLMEKIVPHQLANGGNILMIQIENEYGSFGEEKRIYGRFATI